MPDSGQFKFNLCSFYVTGLPNMDSKDVEEIFKGVLTDESQESQESTFPLTEVGPGTSTPVHASVPLPAGMVSPSGSVTHPGNSIATHCMSNFCIVGAFDIMPLRFGIYAGLSCLFIGSVNKKSRGVMSGEWGFSKPRVDFVDTLYMKYLKGATFPCLSLF
jgi:hypothetical protein